MSEGSADAKIGSRRTEIGYQALGLEESAFDDEVHIHQESKA
jgi:hypothetical protein